MKAKVDYSALFRDSPNACLILAPDHTVVDANEAALRISGHTREELVGVDLFASFPADPDDSQRRQIERIKASIAEVFRTGRSNSLPLVRYAMPISSVEGDGQVEVLWSASQHPLFGEDGEVSHVFQFIRDVSALDGAVDGAIGQIERGVAAGEVLRRAEAVQLVNRTLEAERQRLLRLFDQSLSFVVFMREPEHIVELANPAYLKMVGETDLRDRRYGEAHVSDAPVPIKLLDAVYESGVPIIEHGLALRVPDGHGGTQTIYVDVVIQQIVDLAGKVIGVFMQGNDVTMAKATHDELSAYRTRLEEMVAARTRALEHSENERRNAEAALHRAQRLEAVGKLTGGVAHDFNNVLQIIRGNLQLVQRGHADDPKITSRLDAALEGVDRGAKLASQLLAFGRRQPLDPIVVNLGRMLRNLDDLLHRALGESIEIKANIADGLWNTLVDVPRLENVILNIAINARDAMRHRGDLTMELANTTVDASHADREEGLVVGDYVTLAISDTGSGMTPEVQRRAFEPFFTTKPEGEGTGLGLSMVYGFMKQSGGHVSLDSEVGRGTTIRLYLPRSHEPLVDTTVAPLTKPLRGNGETILVVEDDDAVRLTVVETLGELGYRVLRANDGQSGLTIVRSGAPIDLLFTDVIMPGAIPSTELVRQARLSMPNLKVLFTSGFTRDAIVHQDRLQAGVNLLSKPYAREDLARRLRQLLDGDVALGEADRVPSPAFLDNPPTENPDVPTPIPADSPVQRRVLLIEDSEDVRETTIEFIMEVGFAVEAVETAEEALAVLADARFDVIFTDVSLPGMSGIELVKVLLAKDPEQRIVIASGYGADLGKLGFGNGVAVLGKPYDLATLEKTLHRVLDAKLD
jgi:signal transduction histidine kinase/DNA-binding response OmpR family regulator